MGLFYVDKSAQNNGDHIIHTATCTHSPDLKDRDSLGYHTACRTALDAAKKIHPQSNGCYYCSYSSYTDETK